MSARTRPRIRSAVVATAFVAAGLALAACGATEPATPSPSADPAPFDFSGTAWRAVSVAGQGTDANSAPSLEFDWLGRPEGHGFTGCDEFAFSARFDGGRISVDGLDPPPTSCDGPTAQMEALFVRALQEAEAWSVDGDRLTLAGVPGLIVLARQLPSVGDPGRELADTLRDGQWRVIRATGVPIARLPPVLFADAMFIAAGECGFSGDIRFGSGGAVEVAEVGWDLAGCAGAGDGRLDLKRVLEAVTKGRLAGDGTAVLSGPEGEVVLGR